MMEDHQFCDSCEGCRPAMLDLKTGQVLPRSDPMMIAICEKSFGDIFERDNVTAEIGNTPGLSKKQKAVLQQGSTKCSTK